MKWKEFRPTIFFLIRFLAVYLSGSVLYGFYVTGYDPTPDPVTHFVTVQTAWVLDALGTECVANDNPAKATVWLMQGGRVVVSVYEGCNGINVMVIFVSFLIAFGPWKRQLMIFILVGILVIHLANLVRIGVLFQVAIKLPAYFYFSHKYLFTASLYVLVLLMWMIWLQYFAQAGKR